MITIAAVVLVVATIAAALVPRRFTAWVMAVGVTGLALCFAGFGFLVWGPRDYLTRWPFLQEVLHPYQIVLYATVAMIVGASAWLGLAARMVLQKEGSAR
ncbi:MAG TPA: hypothetical protein VJY35_15975 [Candidatus Eisenbacteria bacterium]|nr:hypothetical protein [Candidatus Eisenbacteria bacterium]